MKAVALTLMLTAAAVAGPAADRTLIVATSRGESPVTIVEQRGHAALATPSLEALLPVVGYVEGDWADVSFAGLPFRFLLGAPVIIYQGRSHPLAGGAYVTRDTLYVPLQWLSEVIPSVFAEGYRYDPLAVRFEEARLTPVIATGTAAPAAAAATPRVTVAEPSRLARENGFRMRHLVVIDAGHGGVDPGNPGLFLPRGVNEKHVTLSIAKHLERILKARGVEVRMTRTTDTLISRRDRAALCRNQCDAFVSIHVNSLPRRAGYQSVSGFETYFLGVSATAEARRVVEMENSALRYETGHVPGQDDPLAFMFKDLQTNEFLRESAQLADFVQTTGASVHPGANRGTEQANFDVLRLAQRPAILVETGFATNRSDAAFLASANGQERLARAIADGVERYLKQYERKLIGDPE